MVGRQWERITSLLHMSCHLNFLHAISFPFALICHLLMVSLGTLLSHIAVSHQSSLRLSRPDHIFYYFLLTWLFMFTLIANSGFRFITFSILTPFVCLFQSSCISTINIIFFFLISFFSFYSFCILTLTAHGFSI